MLKFINASKMTSFCIRFLEEEEKKKKKKKKKKLN